MYDIISRSIGGRRGKRRGRERFSSGVREKAESIKGRIKTLALERGGEKVLDKRILFARSVGEGMVGAKGLVDDVSATLSVHSVKERAGGGKTSNKKKNL